MSKCYITIFSCCVSRGIHLELIPDLNTSSFLNCFIRFTSRRGTPSLIITDNAKTFKAADKFIGKFYEDEQVREFISKNQIQWRYILAKSPWIGGFYERMVGTVKRCLRKVLGSARLAYDELQTILIEIEATLNSRPITYEYNEVGYEVLTPAHLIYGRQLTTLPEAVSEEDVTDTKFLARVRYLSSKKEHFCTRWHREYLADLREYHKLNHVEPDRIARIGEVVLVHQENISRSSWKVGVIEKVIKGRDGKVRGACVRLIARGKPVYIDRPVQKLYPLEVRAEMLKPDTSWTLVDRVASVASDRLRVKRAAAFDSCWKTRVMLDPGDKQEGVCGGGPAQGDHHREGVALSNSYDPVTRPFCMGEQCHAGITCKKRWIRPKKKFC